MHSVITRAIVPMLLLVGGIAALVFGAKYHAVEVYEEKEITEKLPPEMMSPFPGDPRGPGFPGQPGFRGRFSPPPPIKHKVLEPFEQHEPTLVRDATVGNIERLSDGYLKRSSKLPALCPT
jgi:hypothetical protein